MADEGRAPYAPPATVLAVIRRMHERGLPEMIDSNVLMVADVPESLHARVLVALRFLGLIDDTGRRTELFQRLGRATEDEYPVLLGEIIRSAYAPVFEFGIDPAQDSDRKISDAFRRYEPSGQRDNMARLFRGLCQEAGMAPAGPAEPRPPRPRQPQARQPRVHPRRDVTISGVPATAVAAAESRTDLRPIHQIVDALPTDGWWSADRRERWLRMLESAVDYAIDLRETPPHREVADPPVE